MNMRAPATKTSTFVLSVILAVAFAAGTAPAQSRFYRRQKLLTMKEKAG